MVYVPVGFEGEDWDVPEPVMIVGPVIVHDDDIFDETFTVPMLGVVQSRITLPAWPGAGQIGVPPFQPLLEPPVPPLLDT